MTFWCLWRVYPNQIGAFNLKYRTVKNKFTSNQECYCPAQMQASEKSFHGYYIIPCFTEKCYSTLQDVEVLDQKPKNSFTIESLLSRPTYSALSPKSEELTSSGFSVTAKHLLSSREAVLPHLTRLRTSHPYVDLRPVRSNASFRAIGKEKLSYFFPYFAN